MKKLAKISLFVFTAAFTFASCETKHTENTTESTGEAIKADAKMSADSLEANTEQAIDKAGDVMNKAAEEIEEGAEKVEAEVKEETNH